MEIGLETLSDITVYSKYAKYIPELERRETWDEIVDRYEGMMRKKYKEKVNNERFNEAIELVRKKYILPSMRALQFAGPAIERNESRIYNCCYLPIDSVYAFSEAMFLLLGGTGVGYSVQFHHVDKLPEITRPTRDRKYLIGDSIEGWSDSIKALMKAYLGYTNVKPRFDFSDIRPKGARLITAGGKAPGPEPLKTCLFHIETILERKQSGEKLTPLECHDILCHIANAVLAGGIRRAAMIALFSFDDEEMLSCKTGNWYELNEQRGRANNSVVINKRRIKRKEFTELFNKIKASGSGEPGLYFTNDSDWGTNPCAEIALRPFQFCNLCEINVSNLTDKDDYLVRVAAASYLGTLQAGFTDFHYLRPIWKKTTEKDALIGIGMTGIASVEFNKDTLEDAVDIVTSMNRDTAEYIGINDAARTTCVKPSGTTSCVLGTSSGIHAWHDNYYIRRMRIGKNEALYTYLIVYHPELVEDDYFRPTTQAVINIPIKAPQGAITRDEHVLDFLERVKFISNHWVKAGHISGENTHNVSATISIKEEEWSSVEDWIWNNREYCNGLSVLPYDGGNYIQAPFESITEEKYNSMISNLTHLDLSKVIELDDNTDLAGEAACVGNNCEIK